MIDTIGSRRGPQITDMVKGDASQGLLRTVSDLQQRVCSLKDAVRTMATAPLQGSDSDTPSTSFEFSKGASVEMEPVQAPHSEDQPSSSHMFARSNSEEALLTLYRERRSQREGQASTPPEPPKAEHGRGGGAAAAQQGLRQPQPQHAGRATPAPALPAGECQLAAAARDAISESGSPSRAGRADRPVQRVLKQFAMAGRIGSEASLASMTSMGSARSSAMRRNDSTSNRAALTKELGALMNAQLCARFGCLEAAAVHAALALGMCKEQDIGDHISRELQAGGMAGTPTRDLSPEVLRSALPPIRFGPQQLEDAIRDVFLFQASRHSVQRLFHQLSRGHEEFVFLHDLATAQPRSSSTDRRSSPKACAARTQRAPSATATARAAPAPLGDFETCGGGTSLPSAYMCSQASVGSLTPISPRSSVGDPGTARYMARLSRSRRRTSMPWEPAAPGDSVWAGEPYGKQLIENANTHFQQLLRDGSLSPRTPRGSAPVARSASRCASPRGSVSTPAKREELGTSLVMSAGGDPRPEGSSLHATTPAGPGMTRHASSVQELLAVAAQVTKACRAGDFTPAEASNDEEPQREPPVVDERYEASYGPCLSPARPCAPSEGARMEVSPQVVQRAPQAMQAAWMPATGRAQAVEGLPSSATHRARELSLERTAAIVRQVVAPQALSPRCLVRPHAMQATSLSPPAPAPPLAATLSPPVPQVQAVYVTNAPHPPRAQVRSPSAPVIVPVRHAIRSPSAGACTRTMPTATVMGAGGAHVAVYPQPHVVSRR